MSANQQEVEKIVLGLISEVLRKDVILSVDTDVISVGLNSMGAVCLIARCEEVFSIDIEPEDMIEENMRTPASLSRLLTDQYAVVCT